MPLPDPKATLVDYLRNAHDALAWKTEGVSELDARRPLTPTGTNLLGLVKHLASVELGYFGDTFGRPSGIPLPWHEPDAEPNEDMYLAAEESREWVLDLYARSWAHAEQTLAELDLDAVGRVPWWPPEIAEVTLHRILVHMVAETARHAGHADIVREGLDGAAGRFAWDPSLADGYDWPAHVARVEAAAHAAAGDVT